MCIFLAVGLGLGAATPHNAAFYERDLALSRERIAASVPTPLLVVLAAALPGAVVFLLECLAHWRKGRGGCVQPTVLLGLGLALTSTLLATDALKNFFGIKRPNFFDLCKYATYDAAIDTHDAASPEWELYLNLTRAGQPGTLAKCAGSAALTTDAQRSFPSGHASLSFAGLGFLALALRAFLGVREGDFFSPLALASASPLALAFFIAGTRVRENWHREQDVAVGALLGAVGAVLGWRQVLALGGAPVPSLFAPSPKADDEASGGTAVSSLQGP